MKLRIDVSPGVGAVPYGPAGDQLPAKFTADYTYDDLPLRLKLEVTFDGATRARIERLSLERTDGESVAPEDIVRLRLASVMPFVVADAHTLVDQPCEDSLPHDDLFALARTYWFHWVSWGNPRQQVMTDFGLARSSANYRIRKARERYGLPGTWHAPHSP